MANRKYRAEFQRALLLAELLQKLCGVVRQDGVDAKGRGLRPVGRFGAGDELSGEEDALVGGVDAFDVVAGRQET